ncbi:hypothetical protein [Herbaspirillum robiniae]|uniref:TIR domain-containing protein n=1 Tax=Herbaspirillum robiniae TaxID=2014887 RepID=A0ABX2LYD2_9BURK|nr:hypothetical protein [Herbaspirillum robiniae]NUU02185.1 hypothetical protein [Herbaspirillum robiniae]
MKTIWITSLAKNPARVQAFTAVLKRYGLEAKGHFWTDEPAKMAWRVALDSLVEAKADVWLVLADDEEMAKPGVRYGLSLLAASLREGSGHGFPIVVMWPGKAPAADALPPLLRDALHLEEANAAWPAKIVAKANMPGKAQAPEYRLNVAGDEKLGQWFEIGPRAGNWDGVMFGVAGEGAEIDFQAVGEAGGLPEKTVLEYAQQGMKLQLGETEYTAWAVRNQVGPGQSYYARVKGCPASVLFMPYAEGGDAEATVLRLS